MEFKDFKKGLQELKKAEKAKEIKFWVLNEADAEDSNNTRIIFNGEEISGKVVYLICADELNSMEKK